MKSEITDHIIDVSDSGAVILGPDVACDGFYFRAKARVQSHIHMDHMNDFDTSKGVQDILTSPETYEFIALRRNADIPYRRNIKVVNYGEIVRICGSEVSLYPSGHMLGSVQTQVRLADGTVLGYSGDFQWPLDEVISADALVVDCTCGTPRKTRKFSQETAGLHFIDIVLGELNRSPIMVVAHRGTLQRALDILTSECDAPIVGSRETCRESEIYRRYGYSVPSIYDIDSEEGRDVITEGRYIRVARTWERNPDVYSNVVTITLSAYMGDPEEPVCRISDRHIIIDLSSHADFEGTLSYVEATGAELVVTDNRRGGHAWELAREIQSRLGIRAYASSIESNQAWGE